MRRFIIQKNKQTNSNEEMNNVKITTETSVAGMKDNSSYGRVNFDNANGKALKI